MNELQAQIRERTRKMMAVVAELSMRQAECMTLQQEMKDKELQLDLCQRRVEQGLPPSDNTENEWLRCLQDQHRRQADAEKKARVTFQMHSYLTVNIIKYTIMGQKGHGFMRFVLIEVDIIWTSRLWLMYLNSFYHYKDCHAGSVLC